MFAQNGLILAIPGPGEDWPEAVDVSLAVTLSTCGLVFPGMLNLHNHTAYNTLPLWEAPKLYDNRYQWTKPKP
ncbi:MAG: 5-methylthioadenosine/S-adenosylhomocysteine deaminase [Myxococcota bacterium]